MIAFSEFSAIVTNWLWSTHSIVILLVPLVLILRRLCRPYLSPHWQSLLLVLIFLRLVLPFAPASNLSLQNVWDQAHKTNHTVSLDDTVSSDEIAPASVSVDQTSIRTDSTDLATHTIETSAPQETVSGWDTALSWTDVLAAVWLTGSCCLLVRLSSQSIQLARWLNTLSVADDRELTVLVENCAREVGLQSVPQVLIDDRQTSPAVAGWLRPVILLPENYKTRLTHPQLKFVLLHELRHARCGDVVMSIVLRIIASAHWFNPLVWMAHRSWIADRELSCDNWVLGHVGEDQRRAYGETLLNIVQSSQRFQPLVLTAGMVAFPSLLERRLRAMKTSHRCTRKSIVLGLIASALVASIGLTNATGADRPDSTATSEVAQQSNSASESTSEPAKPKGQLQRPKIVVAQHVYLWNGENVLTEKKLIERFEQLKRNGPVKPHYHFTTGIGLKFHNNDKEWTRVTNLADGWSTMTFIGNRGSTLLDQIKSPQDMIHSTESRRVGLVRLPDGSPAQNAQVVIVPVDHPSSVFLHRTKLARAFDEQMVTTNSGGEFIVHPASENYGVYVLHDDGVGFFPGPVPKEGADYQLLDWATVSVDTSNWKNDVFGEFWAVPPGSETMKSGLSIQTLKHSNTPIVTKVPPGKIHISQSIQFDDGIGVFVKTAARMSVSPGEETALNLAPLTAEERNDGEKKHEDAVQNLADDGAIN